MGGSDDKSSTQYQKQPEFWRLDKPARKVVFRAAAASGGGVELQQVARETFGWAWRPLARAMRVARPTCAAVP